MTEDGPISNLVTSGMRYLSVPAEPVKGQGTPTVAAVFTPGPEHRGAPGYLHGGIAALLLDEVIGAVSHWLDGMVTVTGKLELAYRRPVPLDGTPIVIEAWRTHPECKKANRMAGRVLLFDGRVAVEASGLFVRTQPLGEGPPSGGYQVLPEIRERIPGDGSGRYSTPERPAVPVAGGQS